MKVEPCNILKLFLNFSNFEPQYSYRLYSYKKKECRGAYRQLNYKLYLQNRALSITESVRYKDPWPKIWLNAENFVLFDRSSLVYKILNKLCPESFWNMFHLDHLCLIIILELLKIYIFQ